METAIFFMVGSRRLDNFAEAMQMMRITREPVIAWEEKKLFFRKTKRVIQIIWR